MGPTSHESLHDARDEALTCTRCDLAKTRTEVVYGEGPLDADLMFIGEAPGRQEDKLGKPFVGDAGKFLDERLYEIELPRSEVYITNVVKCRPIRIVGDRRPNRAPEDGEIDACAPWFDEQIRVIDPPLIVPLGVPAAERVLEREVVMGEAHGHCFVHAGRRVVPTWHPAYVRINQNLLPAYREDFLAIRAALDLVRTL